MAIAFSEYMLTKIYELFQLAFGGDRVYDNLIFTIMDPVTLHCPDTNMLFFWFLCSGKHMLSIIISCASGATT